MSLVMKVAMVMTMCPLWKPKPRIGLRRERQRQRASPAKEAGRRMWRNTRSSIPLPRRSQFLAWTTKQQFFLYSSTRLKKLDFQSSLSTQIIMPNTLFIFNIYVVWFGLCIFLPPLLLFEIDMPIIDQLIEAFHLFGWLNKLNSDCFGAVLQNRIDKPAILSYLFLTCGICPGEKPPAFLV